MKGGKFLKNFIIVVLIVFFIYQFVASLNNPFTTVSASYYETFKGIDANALLIRNETIIESDAVGVKSFTINNGERVSKNGVLANVFASEDVSNVYSQINNLNEQIKSLENLSLYHDSSTDINIVTDNINSKIIELNESCKNGKINSSDQLSAELFAMLSSKSNIIGLGGDSHSYVTNLKTQLESLKASAPKPQKVIYSPISGYFIDEVDGYENSFNIENILNLTPNEFKSIKPTNNSENSLCKIVSDHNWYFATEISSDDALKLKEGSKYVVLTDQNAEKEIATTLVALNSDEESNNVLAVFSFKDTDKDLATVRNLSITIVLERYKGIKLPNRAIRMVDEKLGVYVVYAGIIKFKPVTPLYSTDTFTVCEIDKIGQTNSLRLYDEVIDKGKNLYDGKTIN